ncbi:hypothetical protein HPB47_013067 [Ixodes persulcatus]|uniref:Uncharacterized protein n=1 Tax=Ixodes persulcatus TaxID=34615 RepID=A0AC60NRU8_IXOPE|nr:hypothetical protein HPB47_013067 [Ixodes persulcatus]
MLRLGVYADKHHQSFAPSNIIYHVEMRSIFLCAIGVGGSCCCPYWGAGAPRAAAKISGETWPALDSERSAGPLLTASA